MTETLPDPLVPAEVDLRDFPFVPIIRGRLFNSGFHARANDAEWRAGVTLWLKSWDQVPAGTLPDDETELCRLAEMGRDLRGWRKVRERALHGWTRRSDGRLHHETVATGVLEAWLEKLAQRLSSGAGNAKRWGIPFDSAEIEAQMAEARTLLAALDPHSRALTRKRTAALPKTSDQETRQESQQQSRRDSRHDPKRQRQGREGNNIDSSLRSESPPGKPPNGSRLPADWKPGHGLLAWAVNELPAGLDLEAETEKFRDYWTAQPGAKGRKTDWDATWRNWMRKASERLPGYRPPSQQPQHRSGFAAMAAGQDRQPSFTLEGKARHVDE